MTALSTKRRSALLATLLAALCLLQAGGCAGGERFRPEQLAPGDAVIYVYRPRSAISPGPVAVFVNQQQVARLSPNQYVAAVVAPGEHLVRVQRRSDATRRVRVGPGESAFLQTRASLLGGTVSLARPGEQSARDQIASARRAAPRDALTPAPQEP